RATSFTRAPGLAITTWAGGGAGCPSGAGGRWAAIRESNSPGERGRSSGATSTLVAGGAAGVSSEPEGDVAVACWGAAAEGPAAVAVEEGAGAAPSTMGAPPWLAVPGPGAGSGVPVTWPLLPGAAAAIPVP